jgi:hypothetical protein
LGPIRINYYENPAAGISQCKSPSATVHLFSRRHHGSLYLRGPLDARRNQSGNGDQQATEERGSKRGIGRVITVSSSASKKLRCAVTNQQAQLRSPLCENYREIV